MKKTWLVVILVFLLIIDNTLLPYYSINGSYPSLVFVFAIAYSIIEGKERSIFMGVVSGFLQDIFFFSGFGVNMFLNLILCFLAAKIGEGIFKENRFIPIISMLLISILKVLGVVVIFKLFSQKIYIETALFSALLNSVCMMFLYKFILKTLDKYLDRNTWRF